MRPWAGLGRGVVFCRSHHVIDRANLLPAPRGCPRYFCPTPIILSIFLISRSIFFFHSPRKLANPGTQRVFFRLASLEQASIELRVRRANNRVSG